MTNRNRPRLNITLDPEVKQRAQSVAAELNISTSRLVEEILREFLDSNREDPGVGRNLRREIRQRKQNDEEESATDEQIRNILDQMDQV